MASSLFPSRSKLSHRTTFIYLQAGRRILNYDCIFVNVKLILYELFPAFYFFYLFPAFSKLDKYYHAGDNKGRADIFVYFREENW
jgi:hypothetical protein